ncbi:MAG TPA: serine hydrolase [Gemmatimonadaceae bacterium]|nr:serine hydrolase [Gemmatimonadaceae bacterium]
MKQTSSPNSRPQARPVFGACRRASLLGVLSFLAACATARPAPVRPATPSPAAITDSVRAVLLRGLADSAYPGAYAVVGSSKEIYASMGVGHLDWATSPVPNENTMWDMASLSKVIGTTTAAMQLWEQGRLNLDAPVQKYIPEFTGRNKELVTVRNLLTHSSGLPAWRPLYKEARTPEEAIELVFTTPLDTLPNVRMVYSDLGIITLGKIIERISGESLDGYLSLHVFGPLGMKSTMYRPPAWVRQRIAPTERDPWRGRLVYGEVHDENSYALGGVAGHAGLFSTGHDLAIFAQMYLNEGVYDSVRIVHETTVKTFTQVQDSTLSNRALGWEVPSGTNSAGHLLSRHAFGHTGFTGTSIWMDPDRDLFVILLTNRVDPSRESRGIYAVRPALADAVAEAQDASMGRKVVATRASSPGSSR